MFAWSIFAKDSGVAHRKAKGGLQKAQPWFLEAGSSRLLATRQRHHDLRKAEKKQLWVLMKAVLGEDWVGGGWWDGMLTCWTMGVTGVA